MLFPGTRCNQKSNNTQEFLQRLNTCSDAKKNKLVDLLNAAACYHLWQHRECELRDVAEVWEQSQCPKITGFIWSCSCRWKKMSFCKCQHKQTVPSVTAVTCMSWKKGCWVLSELKLEQPKLPLFNSRVMMGKWKFESFPDIKCFCIYFWPMRSSACLWGLCSATLPGKKARGEGPGS